MSDFDPGLGWREVTEREWLSTPIDDDHLELASHGNIRHWVRDVLVPPLPTAPYTVIRVTWREDEGARNLVRIQAPQESMWQTLTTGPVKYWGSKTLAELITSFEVLSEPRAATAKAVLDRVRATGLYELLMVANPDNGADLDKIAREFGVEG